MGRTIAVGAAILRAGLLLALTETAREAEATFPGENGRVASSSNRTTGEGVNNPEGDFEIYEMRANGSESINLTSDPAGDFTPDWRPPR